jgi:hypothetical protein
LRILKARATTAAVLALGAMIVVGCTTPAATSRPSVGPALSRATSDVGAETAGPPTSTTAPVGSSGSPTSADSAPALASLVVDDGPAPGGYLRDLFPTWKDIDHDGCDARRQALVAASTTPAQVGERCAVIAGTWTSAYDGITTTNPSDIQIDHVIPLANAWRSGAHAWTTDQRTAFANDQAELWAVSAVSNQSKGDSGPEQWRPPRREVWCEYAQRWVAIKVRWHLTATTFERDALGQMLDTC